MMRSIDIYLIGIELRGLLNVVLAVGLLERAERGRRRRIEQTIDREGRRRVLGTRHIIGRRRRR